MITLQVTPAQAKQLEHLVRVELEKASVVNACPTRASLGLDQLTHIELTLRLLATIKAAQA